MFADDCIIYKEITCREDQIILNKALEHITQWCRTWQMVTNTEKTVSMTVSNKKARMNFPYRLEGKMLKKVEEYKYLGVIISSDLIWDKQITYVVNKALVPYTR